MCQDCVRSLPKAPSTLCITRDTMCMCVCVCHCLLPHPPLRPPDVHSPLILISGGATLTCVKCACDHCPRLHLVCVSRGTLFVCLFAIACPLHPPLHPPDVYNLPIYLVGGNTYLCQDCVRSLPEAPSILCITRDTLCVCVCVYLTLPAPPTPHCVLPVFMDH